MLIITKEEKETGFVSRPCKLGSLQRWFQNSESTLGVLSPYPTRRFPDWAACVNDAAVGNRTQCRTFVVLRDRTFTNEKWIDGIAD